VWNSAAEFFNMGGYGLYVWGSVGVTLALMFSEVVLVRMRKSSAIRRMIRMRALDSQIADEHKNNFDDSRQHDKGSGAA
jgi:heme exporter protein D